MNPTARLRIATRIHFALLRHYGERVEITSLLRGNPEGREALWVCEASGNPELVRLAQQLHEANSLHTPALEVAQPAAEAAPQDAVWAQNTTGFGVSRLQDAPDEATTAAPEPHRRRSPFEWLRRGGQR